MKPKGKPMMNQYLRQLLETNVISSHQASYLAEKQFVNTKKQQHYDKFAVPAQSNRKSDNPCQTKQSICTSEQSKTFKQTGEFDKRLSSVNYISLNTDPFERQDFERGCYEITSCQLRKYPPLPSKRQSQRNQHSNRIYRVKSQLLQKSLEEYQQLKSQSSKKKQNSTKSQIHITQKFPIAITQSRNKHFMSVQLSDSDNDFHNELYERARRQSLAKKTWIQKQRRYYERQIQKQCTHSPNLNQVSKQIAKRIKTCYNQSVIKHSRRHSQMSKSYIQNKQAQQIKQCSFQPKINPLSKKIVSYRCDSLNKSIFQSLYQDSKIRSVNKKKLEINQLNRQRKPSIDKLSNKMVGQSKFMQRMQFYQSEKERKKVSQQKQNQLQNSSLYKPKVGKAPKKYNAEKLPIGEYLYLKAQQKTLKQVPHKKTKIINQMSEKCYQRRKIECFQRIFNTLDDDEDGQISFIDINILGLPKEVLQIVKPILYQLQMMEAKLNSQQFILSMDKLFNSLTINERNVLLDNRKKTFVDDYCFKPNLNAKSKEIASQIDRDKINIYDFCAIKQKLKNKHLNQSRLQKRKQQMQKCTFYPKIKYYRI